MRLRTAVTSMLLLAALSATGAPVAQADPRSPLLPLVDRADVEAHGIAHRARSLPPAIRSSMARGV